MSCQVLSRAIVWCSQMVIESQTGGESMICSIHNIVVRVGKCPKCMAEKRKRDAERQKLEVEIFKLECEIAELERENLQISQRLGEIPYYR